jgi:hypothetical protein
MAAACTCTAPPNTTTEAAMWLVWQQHHALTQTQQRQKQQTAHLGFRLCHLCNPPLFSSCFAMSRDRPCNMLLLLLCCCRPDCR